MAIKPCPECGTSIALTAKHCDCGWSATPRAKVNEGSVSRNHQCQWRANGLQCRFPVGFFDIGASDGYCLFHRNQMNGATGAEYVEASQKATRGDYLNMARVHVYGPELSAPDDGFIPSKTTEEAQARCMALMKTFKFSPPPSKAWAKKLIERHKYGEVLLPSQLEMANRAMGEA